MKKRFMSMLMVLVLLAGILAVPAFAAQGEVESQTYEGCAHIQLAWVVDGDKCWQECRGDGCDYTANIGTHADSGDADYACDRCGEHIHSMTAMAHDDAQHWTVCADTECPNAMIGEKVDHSWTVDTANTDATVEKYICACGASKSEHAHAWGSEWGYDAQNHWHECENEGCTAENADKDAYGAHSWTKDTAASTDANAVYTCVCGQTKTDHSHVWNTTYSYDGYSHWYACSDTTCSSTNGSAKHTDYNGDNVCDVAACAAPMTATVLSSLTIKDVTVPVDGKAVSFGVTIEESNYGTPVVHWNRFTQVNGSDSVVLNAYNTYSAGCMYDLEIWVPYNKNDPVATNINITVNGEKVQYYTTLAAYVNAKSTFEGVNPVYRAHFDTKDGVPYMVISVLFGKVGGTHTCVYTGGWITSATQHYHKCTGCDAVKDAASHLDSNSNGLCDACNYEMGTVSTGTGTATHTHSYAADWVEDTANHWKQCTTCGTKTQTAAHADLNSTGLCDVCGYVMTAQAGHTHSYGSDWTETFAQHYKLCSCGAKTEIAAHADANNSGLCDVCGYAMTTTSTGTTTTVPVTGDDNAAFLWMAAMLVSVLGLIGSVVIARKGREE